MAEAKMRVAVDTSVWSLAFRRHPGDISKAEEQIAAELRALIVEGNAVLIGLVRQELLSGVRDQRQFLGLRDDLRQFGDFPLTVEDYEEAARAHNTCRSVGVAGSLADFLLCGVALRHELAVFTVDKDFQQYARHLPLRLHRPRPISS